MLIKSFRSLSPDTSFTQGTQTPSSSVVKLIAFPASQADGKSFSFAAPCPHLFRLHKILQQPPNVRGNLSLAALPLCVFGSALSSLQNHPQAMFTPFLQPCPDLLDLPCSSWNASTNFPQEKGSSNTTRLHFRLLICHFIETEEKASPALFCSHSIPRVQHPLCPQHKLCFCDPAAHRSCLLWHSLGSCPHVGFAGSIIQWAQHAALTSSSCSTNLQFYKFPIVSHTDFKDLLVI